MRRFISRSAVIASTAALVGGAALVVAPPASAVKAPSVTFTSGPTVSGTSVTIGYRINRQYKAVASQSCWLTNTATNAMNSVVCGTAPASATPKTIPAAYSVMLTNLGAATYTYTVQATLTDGGRATATTSPFTIQSTAQSVCESFGLTYLAGAPPGYGDPTAVFSCGGTQSPITETIYGPLDVQCRTFATDDFFAAQTLRQDANDNWWYLCYLSPRSPA